MFASKKIYFTASLLVITALLAACNAPTAPTVNAETILTQAAGTAAARLTEAAASVPSPTASETPAPSATPQPPTPTLEPTATQPPAQATATLAPTTPPQTTSADSASFVADVNYPDNTTIKPGETLTKTWRIKNNGTTTWTTSYSLVCIDPGKFQCTESVSIPKEVKSGETIEISVSLTAPTAAGTYKAFFRMRNAAGQFFKLDGGDLWAQLIVGQGDTATKPGSPTSTSTVQPSVTPTTQ